MFTSFETRWKIYLQTHDYDFHELRTGKNVNWTPLNYDFRLGLQLRRPTTNKNFDDSSYDH